MVDHHKAARRPQGHSHQIRDRCEPWRPHARWVVVLCCVLCLSAVISDLLDVLLFSWHSTPPLVFRPLEFEDPSVPQRDEHAERVQRLHGLGHRLQPQNASSRYPTMSYRPMEISSLQDAQRAVALWG